MRLAAVDVGTNTVRLLVGDVQGARIASLARRLEITRLGQGVDEARSLAPDAVQRTLAVIERFASTARELGAEQVRIAGTSVLRDASDADVFADQVRERAASPLEILDGKSEGRIAYLGATQELGSGTFVVCDIGGGSTELCTAADSISLDIGSVRLKERWLHADPPTPDEIADASAVIDAALDGVNGDMAGELVGVAGTITTLAAVVLGLDRYDAEQVHRSRMTMDEVRDGSDRLLAMSAGDIAALGPVERGRADVIGGGSLILRCVMERWGYEDVLVSERDILDGLVLDLAERLA